MTAAPWPQVVETAVESGPDPATAVIKWRLRLHDGHHIEAVRLPMGRGRAHLCISTQVGCRMGCVFCASGQGGLVRNLSAEEIVAQVRLGRRAWPDITRVVCMGMGEALDNLSGLLPALQRLTASDGEGLARSAITVCTAGHIPGLAALAELGWKRLDVAVSLHSARDVLRRSLLPVIARRWPLAALQEALLAYRPRPNFQYSINFILLPGINDAPAEFEALAAFCAPLGRVMVKLLPYNPGMTAITHAPSEAEITAAVAGLRAVGLPVRRRVIKGRSIMAACGQLAARP